MCRIEIRPIPGRDVPCQPRLDGDRFSRTWIEEAQGEVRLDARDRRTFRQLGRDAGTNFAELPTAYDWGRKLNSKGHVLQWRGYMLHLSVGDSDIPLTAFLSSARLHDSQVAIPMMQKTSRSFSYFYDLADCAYDANDTLEESIALGHRPLVELNLRKDEARRVGAGILPAERDRIRSHAVNIIPAEELRYRFRTGDRERVFSQLHDAHSGKSVRVRGGEKVFLHPMFSVLVVVAEQILKLLSRQGIETGPLGDGFGRDARRAMLADGQNGSDPGLKDRHLAADKDRRAA